MKHKVQVPLHKNRWWNCACARYFLPSYFKYTLEPAPFYFY